MEMWDDEKEWLNYQHETESMLETMMDVESYDDYFGQDGK